MAKEHPNYWSLSAFGDVVGWTFRKDWFARPELQAEFKEKYGRDLAVPATLAELMDARSPRCLGRTRHLP